MGTRALFIAERLASLRPNAGPIICMLPCHLVDIKATVFIYEHEFATSAASFIVCNGCVIQVEFL